MRRFVLSVLVAAVLGISGLGSAVWAGGYGHSGHYGHGYSGHYGSSDGDELLAGLLIGGLFGWFLNEDRHYARRNYETRRYYRDYPIRTYSTHTHYKSYDGGYPTVHYHTYGYPDSSINQVALRAPSGCVMTREYTTTINIDGIDRAAYGTRCMQADGSWELGAPKLVPAN